MKIGKNIMFLVLLFSFLSVLNAVNSTDQIINIDIPEISMLTEKSGEKLPEINTAFDKVPVSKIVATPYVLVLVPAEDGFYASIPNFANLHLEYRPNNSIYYGLSIDTKVGSVLEDRYMTSKKSKSLILYFDKEYENMLKSLPTQELLTVQKLQELGLTPLQFSDYIVVAEADFILECYMNDKVTYNTRSIKEMPPGKNLYLGYIKNVWKKK